MSQNIEVVHVGECLNKNAKEYIPSKCRYKEKEKFDLNKVQYIEADEDEEDEENDIQEKIEKIEKDIIEAEAIEELGNDFSEDEDVWIPKYKDCECCKGFVFNCRGETCADLGQCYCKMKDECDKKLDETKNFENKD